MKAAFDEILATAVKRYTISLAIQRTGIHFAYWMAAHFVGNGLMKPKLAKAPR